MFTPKTEKGDKVERQSDINDISSFYFLCFIFGKVNPTTLECF